MPVVLWNGSSTGQHCNSVFVSCFFATLFANLSLTFCRILAVVGTRAFQKPDAKGPRPSAEWPEVSGVTCAPD